MGDKEVLMVGAVRRDSGFVLHFSYIRGTRVEAQSVFVMSSYLYQEWSDMADEP
jgi:hypothetical protein